MTDVTLPNSIANLVKPRRYLSCAETAKLVRKALKEAFPEIKFSVRSDTYSGGASIRVRWTGGPITSQVEAIAKVFEGADFDGMTDYKSHNSHALDGEPVSFGADFIFCNRDSDNVAEDKAAEIFAKTPVDSWPSLASRFGLSFQTACRIADYAGNNPKQMAYYFLNQVSDPKWEGRKSKLAESVNLIDNH